MLSIQSVHSVKYSPRPVKKNIFTIKDNTYLGTIEE